MMKTERVQKIIAQAGYCSRRKAEELIKNQQVEVNGLVIQLGDKANFNDAIKIKGQLLNLNQKQKVYVLLHKPAKVLSAASDKFKRQTVVDLVKTNLRLVPVGRLDYDTTGVMLLTNDYEMVNKLTHPKYEIQRIYRARLDSPLTLSEFKQLNKAVMINNKLSQQIVDQVNTKSYLISLHVGSYHHVKKLFETVNHKVINLKRVAYANLTIDKLPEGTYRQLTLKEIKDLKKIIKIQEAKCQEQKLENS